MIQSDTVEPNFQVLSEFFTLQGKRILFTKTPAVYKNKAWSLLNLERVHV